MSESHNPFLPPSNYIRVMTPNQERLSNLHCEAVATLVVLFAIDYLLPVDVVDLITNKS
jgi:hypothetical protein